MKLKLQTSVQEEERQATRISAFSIAVNFILAVGKLTAGLTAHSTAMVSDAVHSASDILTTVIVIVGVRLSYRQPDEGHPYGHERLESAATLILAMLLGMTGLGIGYTALQHLFFQAELQSPGAAALFVALTSIVVKEGMYRITKKTAQAIHSEALMADAWHHRSDAFSSIGAFIGIFTARHGLTLMDPLAGLVICVLILSAAADLFRQALDKMVDKACDAEIVDQMRKAVLREAGVQSVDLIRTRLFGSRVYVDIEIGADGGLSLTDSHWIAEAVHHTIETQFPMVKHCMVHVNPVSSSKA